MFTCADSHILLALQLVLPPWSLGSEPATEAVEEAALLVTNTSWTRGSATSHAAPYPASVSVPQEAGEGGSPFC